MPRQKFHRGKWQLQRERAQIDAITPASPDCLPRTLGDGLLAALKAVGPPPDAWLAELAVEWPMLVGADVARHTRPAGIERRTLLVYVDSSVWLSELQRYGQKQILSNLQRRFGTDRVPALRLSLDPDQPTGNVQRSNRAESEKASRRPT